MSSAISSFRTSHVINNSSAFDTIKLNKHTLVWDPHNPNNILSDYGTDEDSDEEDGNTNSRPIVEHPLPDPGQFLYADDWVDRSIDESTGDNAASIVASPHRDTGVRDIVLSTYNR